MDKLTVMCFAAMLRLLMFIAMKVAFIAIHDGDYAEGVTSQFRAVELLADKALRGLEKVQ
jgi:hypothetical protein